MTTVSRLSGAILVQDGARFFLVGDTKEPLRFSDFGFSDPKDRDPAREPVVELSGEHSGEHSLSLASQTSKLAVQSEPLMVSEDDGPTVAALLGRALVIRRNGSVSERLWSLVMESSPPKAGKADIQWLSQTPEPIWEIVRDTVLRCS